MHDMMKQAVKELRREVPFSVDTQMWLNAQGWGEAEVKVASLDLSEME